MGEQILALDNLFETLRGLLTGSVGDQHLSLGLMGNLAVAIKGRETLVADSGMAAAVAMCLEKSLNAHVMMNAAVLLRRMALLPAGAKQVAALLPQLTAQRERLNQPEHVRIALEIGRSVALCCGEEGAVVDGLAHQLLLELLEAEWIVLKVEACRGCALLEEKCPEKLVEIMIGYLANVKSDLSVRFAAAIALSKCAMANAQFLETLETVSKEEEQGDAVQPEGQKLSDLAKKMLEAAAATKQ